MWQRRIVYALALVGALVFYWAYREWLSWLLLMALVWLPWVSLALSLPAMLKAKPVLRCPGVTHRGETVQVRLESEGRLPSPPMKGRLLLERRLLGQTLKKPIPARVPTEHCARVVVRVHRAYMYDYLGLFRWRLRRVPEVRVTVRPELSVMDNPPDISRYLANSWRPKPGGGFAENHELRLYRPGDPLRMVHWKLSAKTGKLVLREPMEPLRGRAMVTMELRGTPEQLDRKLGRLLWVCNYLLANDMPHEIRCLTGDGMLTWQVTGEDTLLAALDGLLECGPASRDAQGTYPAAAWHYHIGGGGDEA